MLAACLLEFRCVVHASELDLTSVPVGADDGIDRRGGVTSRAGDGSEKVSADIKNEKQDRFTAGAWSLLQDHPVESHQLAFLGGFSPMSLQRTLSVLNSKHLPIHASAAIWVSRGVRHQVLDSERFGVQITASLCPGSSGLVSTW